VLQSVGESCRVMQSVADGVVEHHGVLQCSVLQCSVLQCIVNCCSISLRCVDSRFDGTNIFRRHRDF